MIEIPKYTMPTYDPNALEDNRRTDFTRRIPTGLSDKQMARDSKIAMQLIRIEYECGGTDGGAEEKILDLFFRKAKLLSNPRYWELMRTVWVAAGTTETAQRFRTLMKSKRPCKSWFMTPEDAEALDKMQFPLLVHRAYDAERYPDDTDPGISWTLDGEWCKQYAASKGRKIKSRMVERDEIFAYVTRRGEEEMEVSIFVLGTPGVLLCQIRVQRTAVDIDVDMRLVVGAVRHQVGHKLAERRGLVPQPVTVKAVAPLLGSLFHGDLPSLSKLKSS